MEPCPHCGQPVRATARFCTHCGFRIPERSSTSTPVSSSAIASTEQSTVSGTAIGVSESAPESNGAGSVAETAEILDVEVAKVPVIAAPAVIADPIAEIVAATAGFNGVSESLVDVSQNTINIALFHAESLRQMIPDLSAWSEERAQSVNSAIAAMEAALKGREADDNTFYGLRQTVVAARTDPRDIDTMIALSDRSMDIADLLAAHDTYSIGIRTALIDLEPLAVEYVRVPKKRRAPARKATTSRSHSTTSRTKTTIPATLTTSTKSTRSRKPVTSAAHSASS
jgi:hypothetical protein